MVDARAFFLTAVLISSGFIRSAHSNQLPEASRLATVLAVTGDVLKITGKNDHLKLRVGDHLKPKSGIETGSDGNLMLRLGTDVAVQVKPNTHFVIDLENLLDWKVKLESGAMLSAIKNPEKRREHFKITTHAATLGVRGTAFFVRVEKNKPTYLCTCHGTVQVKNPIGKNLKEITATHHDQPIAIGGPLGVSDKIAKVSMDSEHTDADVAALEGALK